LALADWVLVATTLAADWPLTDVLRLSRARWQVDRVCKRMKQLLRFNQLRSTHRTTVEATVRALLIAWALQDGIVAESRALLPTAQQDTRLVVSTGSLVGLGLETLRHQVQHRWSLARLRACLPRLRRCLCSRPRRRAHQATAVRAWLEGRSPQWSLLEENAA
jgi:hypothetical protein